MYKFINELKTILNERLLSIFMYGSKVKYEPDTQKSDINIMVIVDRLCGQDLRNCSRAVKQWCKKGNPPPVFMDKTEWFQSADVYAMEYADIKAAHRILYGQDIVSEIKVEPDNIRLQCELETKNLLMRFRQFYLENANSPSRLKDSFIPLAKTFNAVFKAILRLKFVEVPEEKSDIILKVKEITGLDTEVYEKLLCYKRKQCRMNNHETIDFSDKIVKSLTVLLNYINNM